MKARILLVGEDPGLLATRALLVSDWETENKDSRSAIAVLQTKSFDVVIVGQSVTAEKARLLIDAAHKQKAVPEILALRNPEDKVALAVERHFLDLRKSPAWLEQWVRAALSRRREKRLSTRVMFSRQEYPPKQSA
jgi:hypothetical protein